MPRHARTTVRRTSRRAAIRRISASKQPSHEPSSAGLFGQREEGVLEAGLHRPQLARVLTVCHEGASDALGLLGAHLDTDAVTVSPDAGSPARRRSSAPAARSATLTHMADGRVLASTSATDPCATVRPPTRWPPRSQTCSTSPSRWLDRNTVRPSAPRRRDELPHLADPGRVEPIGRFVEDEQLRVLQERDRRSRAAGACPASSPRTRSSARSASPTRSSVASTVASADPRRGGQDGQRLAAGHARIETRRLDQCAHPRDHVGQTRRATRPRARGSGRCRAAPDRAGNGSWSSCPTRSDPGTRTRHRQAPTARARRAARTRPPRRRR